MVEIEEDLNERLVAIKKDIRQAQLQVNRLDLENVDVGRVAWDIEEHLGLALVSAMQVPPIERMIDEVLSVWKLIAGGHQKEPRHDGSWVTGCTFAIIAAIDFMLEVDA